MLSTACPGRSAPGRAPGPGSVSAPRRGRVLAVPRGCQAVGREMSLTPGRRERGMNEGAVQRRVARAHLPATVPPLCRLLLRSLPRSQLSSWASTSLLWGSKIRVFTACELCLSGCPPLFVHPSLCDVNHTLEAQVLVLSLSLSARVPGQAPGWQCRIYLQELLAPLLRAATGLADGARGGGSHQGGTVPTTNRWLQLK